MVQSFLWFIKPDATAELHSKIQEWEVLLIQAGFTKSLSISEKPDVIISVGGDGTLLHASREASVFDIPVVGIHQGHLGFLTTIQAEHAVESLISIFSGDHLEEKRMLLHAKLTDGNGLVREGLALNDVVLKSAEHLLTLSLSIDQKPSAIWRADGVIIASPTGSTAYSLAAGGALLEPEIEAMMVVPLCPQTLTHRPIVVSSKRTLSFSHNNSVAQRCALDGHDVWRVQPQQKLEISSASKPLRLWHPPKSDFYDTLRRKLGWNAVDNLGLPLPNNSLNLGDVHEPNC